MPIKGLPLTRMSFSRLSEVRVVVAEADQLSRRKLRPHRPKQAPSRAFGVGLPISWMFDKGAIWFRLCLILAAEIVVAESRPLAA